MGGGGRGGGLDGLALAAHRPTRANRKQTEAGYKHIWAHTRYMYKKMRDIGKVEGEGGQGAQAAGGEGMEGRTGVLLIGWGGGCCCCCCCCFCYCCWCGYRCLSKFGLFSTSLLPQSSPWPVKQHKKMYPPGFTKSWNANDAKRKMSFEVRPTRKQRVTRSPT